MASSHCDLKLNIISMNVRGLRNAKKRRSLFRQFKTNNYDIIGLQETYLTNNDINLIKNEWGDNFHISEGTTHSKGLLTLFGSSIKYDDATIKTKNERCLISKITIDKVNMCVANFYGPCNDNEKCSFLGKFKTTINRIYTDSPTDNLIVLGDFNIVINNKVDIVSGQPHNPNIVKLFNDNINELLLNDIWRLNNGNIKDFTWSKKNPLLARRLDYIFIDNDLLPFCVDSNIKTFGFSDHRAVTITLDFASFKRGPGTFKFNTNLLHNIDFVNDVKKEILHINNMDLNPHIKWEYIKIQIKSLGMMYGRSLAIERSNNKKELYHDLKEIEKKIVTSPECELTAKKYDLIKQKLESIIVAETEGARIRSGQRWAEEGEKCTKYFLNLEKQRSKSNTIFKLMKQNSLDFVTTSDDILSELTNNFSNIYNVTGAMRENECNFDKLFLDKSDSLNENEVENLNIENELVENDVLLALKKSKNGSSPGLDGLPCEVYKFFWIDLKKSIMDCFNYSFKIGSLADSQRQGMICLLHKGKGCNREDISSWRPITLTNYDYKLLAKVLSMKLVPFLDECVDSDQHAFIKGRSIANMLREIDDIVEFAKSEALKGMILSLDYAKAFDTLSVNAIIKAAKYFNIGDNFIKWIQILLYKRESCVRNGGFLSPFFLMHRGVRQGCPISPLLFIMTVELLAINIRKDENIKGIYIPGSKRPIKIRQYADDTTMFLKDVIDFREILSKIKKFAEFSGLNLNKNKSFVMMLSDSTKKNHLKFGIRFVNQIKVLGINFSNETKASENAANFDNKIEQLKRICSLWAKRKLSILGKITILKSFGLSLFVYIMQSVGIPEEKLNEINTICFRFIWNTNSVNKKTHEKVKRKIICSKKEWGGLKMFNIIDSQNSFYFSWAKRLWSNTEETWKEIPKIIFHKIGGSSAFASNVSSKEYKGLYLLKNKFWKTVLQVWLDNNAKFQSSNDQIDIHSPLFNNTLIKYKNKTIFISHCCRQSIVRVKDVIKDGKIVDIDNFSNVFGSRPDTVLTYNVIFNALYIHKITIQNLKSDDRSPSKLGFANQIAENIDRRMFIDLIKDKETPYVHNLWSKKFEVDFDKKIWLIPFNCCKETRLQILQWKILHYIYPTGVLLKKMKIKDTELCSFCASVDTIDHFFFHCNVVSTLWKEIEKMINIKTGQSIQLDCKSVLLGFQNNKFTLSQINYINYLIIIGKHVISKCKYRTITNMIVSLKNELTLRKLSF